MSETRTRKALLNSSTGLVSYLLTISITIFSRRYFLEALGADVSGLITSLGGFLSMLALAELGVGEAIVSVMYKPLHDRDTKSLNEIISLQGWFYRNTAGVVLLFAMGSMCFFPSVYGETFSGDRWWYPYAIFLSSLLISISSYLFTYKLLIFHVDQRGYRITWYSQALKMVQDALLLFALWGSQQPGLQDYLPTPMVSYVGIAVIRTLLGALLAEYLVKKEYGWIKSQPKEGNYLRKKYSEVLKKVSQLFGHRLIGAVVGNITPFAMTFFVPFVMIGYYVSYSILASNLGNILNAFLNSVHTGIGALLAEGNLRKSIGFLFEYLSIKHFFGTIASFAFFAFSSALIPIWLGDNPDYILPTHTVALMAIASYFNIVAGPVDSFIAGKGMFGDVWATFARGLLQVGLGLGLGYLYGLDGIIVSSILVYIVISIGWKPYYLFRKGFRLSPWMFYRTYIKYPLIALSSTTLFWCGIQYLDPDFSTLWSFLLNAGAIGACYILVIASIYYVVSQGFRDLCARFWEIASKALATKRGGI